MDDQTDCESDYDSLDEASNTPLPQRIRKRFSPQTMDTESPGALEAARTACAATASPCRNGVDNEKMSKTLDPASALLQSHGLDTTPLPPKRGSRLYRYLRWNFGSVYRRIFTLVFAANMVALICLLRDSGAFTFHRAGVAVSTNIFAAVLVRNEHVVNALFWIFGTWATVLPLWARKRAAKVYTYGGIHSGAAVASVFWYIAFLVLLTRDFQRTPTTVVRGYLYLDSYLLLFLLTSMCLSAHPRFRVVLHNWFEGIHRFAGWLAVLLFWAQAVLLAADAASPAQPLGPALAASPSVWLLLLTTLLIIYPWTRLRRRAVEARVLSPHCVELAFRHGTVHYGQAIRLTDAPLSETHAFGVIPFPAAPSAPSHCQGCTCTCTAAPAPLPRAGEKGFSVIVSAAGDWKRKIIAHPPTHIRVRGAPQFGVLRVAGMFRPVVLVATGSGIAPILSFLVQKPRDHPVRVVWSARRPRETYGDEVVDAVYRADPEAVVMDTVVGQETGRGYRPDLVRVVYKVWEKGACEGVVVISNQKVTRKIVYGLETRGVSVYGAIFDS